VHRSNRFARYYTFTLSQAASVRLDLDSTADNYLYLLSGSGTGGGVLAQDDNGGDSFNARIARDLAAGTYTIEATTWGALRTGSFTLTLTATGGGPGGACVSTIAVDQRLDGTWTADCRATHRPDTYARFYTFTLVDWTNVRIDVVSAVDAYLFLLLGGSDGAVIGQDNDSGGGGGNAQLLRTLAPGTYTIEATTVPALRTGSFTVSLTDLGGAGGPQCGPLQTMLNSTISGFWDEECASVHRQGSPARYYTFSLATPATVQIDLTSALDASLFLFRGAVIGGPVLAQDDDDDEEGDGDARIRLRLPAGTYSVEAATREPGRTGTFTLTLGDAARTTVFLVHGLGQQGGSLDSLASTLRSGLDARRFAVDSGFDWGRCANNPECGDDCAPTDGGRALARYVNARDPQGQIVLIGYGLGGVLARDMMVNNYDGVVGRRKVAALVTLGSPNLGYPYCPEDEEGRCGVLVRDLASQLRLPGGGRILQSAYLEDLNRRWAARSFPGRPGVWLAMAGASCSAERSCKWEEDDAAVQGCPVSGTDARRSDGEVCAFSALFQSRTPNAPGRRWLDSNYAQVETAGDPVLCDGSGARFSLSNPPAGGTLVRAIRDAINRLRVPAAR
jgi:hypothetical protein